MFSILGGARSGLAFILLLYNEAQPWPGQINKQRQSWILTINRKNNERNNYRGSDCDTQVTIGKDAISFRCGDLNVTGIAGIEGYDERRGDERSKKSLMFEKCK